MNWTQTINVKIAERFYPLKIDKEEDEERIRKAGRLINDKLFQYKQSYSDKDVQDFLAIAALQFAVRIIDLEAKAESTEQVDRLKQIGEQLDAFLKQCGDCWVLLYKGLPARFLQFFWNSTFYKLELDLSYRKQA